MTPEPLLIADSEGGVLARLEEAARPWIELLTDPAHDARHIRRVLLLCDRLGSIHHADRDILRAAALLHDIGRVDRPSRHSHAEVSARRAATLLEETGFPVEKRDAVLHCILAHNFSSGIPPRTTEARVFRDADRIDALGAIGIMRAAAHGTAFYHPDDPLAQTDRKLEPGNYCIDHFHHKLLRLREGLFTPEARRIADERITFMESFLHRLGAEIAEQPLTTGLPGESPALSSRSAEDPDDKTP